MTQTRVSHSLVAMDVSLSHFRCCSPWLTLTVLQGALVVPHAKHPPKVIWCLRQMGCSTIFHLHLFRNDVRRWEGLILGTASGVGGEIPELRREIQRMYANVPSAGVLVVRERPKP